MLKDEFCTPWALRCIILRGRGAVRTKPCISSWSPSLAVGNFCHDVGCGLADFRRGATKAKDRCPAPCFSIYQYAKKKRFSWRQKIKILNLQSEVCAYGMSMGERLFVVRLRKTNHHSNINLILKHLCG